MRGQRTYWVSAPDGKSWRVRLRPEEEAWVAEVAADGERWTWRLAPGPGAHRVWADRRPTRFLWEPSTDGAGTLRLAGSTHPLRVTTESEHRLDELGIRGGAAGAGTEVRAPMPGLVLALEVGEGDEVAPGDGIAIIEAMKMENEISAPIGGVVREVSVSKGDAVERDAAICRIEPPADGEEGGEEP